MPRHFRVEVCYLAGVNKGRISWALVQKQSLREAMPHRTSPASASNSVIRG